MSRFRLRTVSSGFGRSLLRSAALIALAGLAMAIPPAEASDCSGEGNPPAIWHSELDYAAHSVAVSGRFAYVVSIRPGLYVPICRFEVFDVVESVRLSSTWWYMWWDIPGLTGCVDVAGDLAFVGGRVFSTGIGLRILDLSDPTAPQIVGDHPTASRVLDVAVDRTTAYLVEEDGLHILDVSDPTSPAPLGTLATPEPAQAVAVSGPYAYLAAGAAGLMVVDLSDPSFPTVAGTCALPGPARDVAIRGSRAYVASGRMGLQVLDVSRPAEPRLIGGAATPGDARSVAVSGARAYVADGNLEVIDIANPRHPVIVNSIVDTPVMEAPCVVRHTEAACVSVGSGRVAVAGTVAHLLAPDCDCTGGDCDDFTGYLDVALAPAYQPPPPGAQRAARMVGSPADAPAPTSSTTVPSTFALRASEPNPFNPETSIRFELPRSSRVRIQIHDARGRLVQTLVEDTLPPGTHEVSWRGRRESGEAVPSGIYFVTMEAENIRRTMKITLLR